MSERSMCSRSGDGNVDELKISKFRCIWTLKNFNRRGKVICSPSFSVRADDVTHTFHIKAHKGTNKEREDYLSLFLKLESQGTAYRVPIKMSFALLNAENEEINKLCGTTVLTTEKDCGYSTLIERKNLEDESYKLLKDDNLRISCKVTILSEHISVPQVPKCSLSDDLGELFESQNFCDVTLSVGEREFLAHKAVLTSRSSVFAAMFKHEMDEKKQNRVIITDIDQDVLKEMLIFIYTGKANNLIKMASDLLIAADKYGLERLKAMCEEELCKKLCIENATNNLILADTHSAKQLKKSAIEFFKEHANQIIETPGWNIKILEYPQLFAEVFAAVVRR